MVNNREWPYIAVNGLYGLYLVTTLYNNAYNALEKIAWVNRVCPVGKQQA